MPVLSSVLPHDVLSAIGAQMRGAVARAVSRFDDSSEEEDTLTGALGMALTDVTGRDNDYTWTTRTKKLRGRGPRATEHVLGPDAVFEFVVLDEAGHIAASKVLPFQAKKNWTGADRLLEGQAIKMGGLPCMGAVVDYSAGGYSATTAHVAAVAGGNRRRVPPEAMQGFGDMLAGDFLACRIGGLDMIYLDGNEAFGGILDFQARRLIYAPARHLIETVVQPTTPLRDT